MEIVNKNNSNFLDSSIFDFENINLSFKKELKGLDDKSDIRSKATILLKEKYKNIKTIIAPRHIDRVQSIKNLCKTFNLNVQILNKDEIFFL